MTDGCMILINGLRLSIIIVNNLKTNPYYDAKLKLTNNVPVSF